MSRPAGCLQRKITRRPTAGVQENAEADTARRSRDIWRTARLSSRFLFARCLECQRQRAGLGARACLQAHARRALHIGRIDSQFL